MEVQMENVKKEYLRKVAEFFENLQQEMEDSYKNIDEALYEFLYEETHQCKVKFIPSQLLQNSTIQSNCQLNFHNDNFQNQILQEVSSFINNQIQQKNKQLKEKEFEVQQLKFQVTKQQQSTLLSNDQLSLKAFTYQLLDQNSIKQNENCYAIAINKDCSIIVAGCQEQIKVFEFKQGILKQVQLLNGHQQDVYTLGFINRSNHFISGSCDNSIIIWARNQNDSWIYQQKLIGHSDTIRCLVLKNNEDVIFSGSSDNSIKFWVKQNDWKCSQTITDHTHAVYGLSLNEQQNRVITCGKDKYILVIEQSEKNKQWLVIQKIQVEQFGVRICLFIIIHSHSNFV